MKHIPAAIAALTLLAGCSNMSASNMNPMNWFDRGSKRPASASEPAAIVDTRELVPQVTEVSQVQISNGVVLLAKGLPPTQGFWEPVLVPTNDEMPLDGILNYEFRASGPTEDVTKGSPQSRELQAARTVTNDKLEGVIGIRVIALSNHMSISM